MLLNSKVAKKYLGFYLRVNATFLHTSLSKTDFVKYIVCQTTIRVPSGKMILTIKV